MTFSKLTLTTAITGILALSACETLEDPNNPNRNTQTGALVGAGVGAVIGAARAGDTVEERNRSIVVGALLGAGLGAGAGVLLDRQEAELRQPTGVERDNHQHRRTADRDPAARHFVCHRQCSFVRCIAVGFDCACCIDQRLSGHDDQCDRSRRQHRQRGI